MTQKKARGFVFRIIKQRLGWFFVLQLMDQRIENDGIRDEDHQSQRRSKNTDFLINVLISKY